MPVFKTIHLHPTTLALELPSQQTQILAPLAFWGPRTEWSRDPDLTESGGRGQVLKRPPWQGRLDILAGKHNTDPMRTHEGQLRPPGGARKDFTKQVMGMMALKEFHKGRRQLKQSTINTSLRRTTQAKIINSCICLLHQTGSSWKVISLQRPSSINLGLEEGRKMSRGESCHSSIKFLGA